MIKTADILNVNRCTMRNVYGLNDSHEALHMAKIPKTCNKITILKRIMNICRTHLHISAEYDIIYVIQNSDELLQVSEIHKKQEHVSLPSLIKL